MLTIGILVFIILLHFIDHENYVSAIDNCLYLIFLIITAIYIGSKLKQLTYYNMDRYMLTII